MFNDVPSRSQILSYTFVDSCVTIAGVTIIAYDYLCTLKEEISYAWSCPWSMGLILFYLNRYLPFLDQSILLYIRFMATSPQVSVPVHSKGSKSKVSACTIDVLQALWSNTLFDFCRFSVCSNNSNFEDVWNVGETTLGHDIPRNADVGIHFIRYMYHSFPIKVCYNLGNHSYRMYRATVPRSNPLGIHIHISGRINDRRIDSNPSTSIFSPIKGTVGQPSLQKRYSVLHLHTSVEPG